MEERIQALGKIAHLICHQAAQGATVVITFRQEHDNLLAQMVIWSLDHEETAVFGVGPTPIDAIKQMAAGLSQTVPPSISLDEFRQRVNRELARLGYPNEATRMNERDWQRAYEAYVHMPEWLAYSWVAVLEMTGRAEG